MKPFSPARRMAVGLIGLFLIFMPESEAQERLFEVDLHVIPIPNQYVEHTPAQRGLLLRYPDGEEWQERLCPWGRTTATIAYEGPSPLYLAMGLGGRASEKTLTIRLSDSTDTILVIAFPTREGGVEAFPLDLGSGQLPRNQVTFINLVDQPIAVQADDQTKVLDPSDLWSIPNRGEVYFQLKTRIAAEHNDRWRLAYRSTYNINSRQGALLLIHRENLDSGTITLSNVPATWRSGEQDDRPSGDRSSTLQEEREAP